MFKIIQTIERGRQQLTIVPANWETNGQLAWPKYNADKLVKNADSVPDETWFRMACKLKRNHLINYQIAEEEMERMLDKDDTEQEEHYVVERKKRPRIMIPKRSTEDDFNMLAKSCMLSEKITEPSEAANDEDRHTQTILSTENNSYQIEILQPNNDEEQIINSMLFTNGSNATTTEIFQLNEKLDTILANQAVITQNQNLIIEKIENLASKELQLKTIEQLAKFEVMLDTIGNTSNTINRSCSCKNAKNASNINDENTGFDQIETVEDIEKLESKLGHKNEMENYTHRLSYICGRSGNGNGINNCYILVDKLFSRKLMTMCSWAGGARGQKEKIPFKIFKNIIRLFFNIIHLSDEHFTLKDCEDFFKAVIKNSTKRNESTLLRTSKPKRRPKNLSYKVRDEQRCNEGQVINQDTEVTITRKDEEEMLMNKSGCDRSQETEENTETKGNLRKENLGTDEEMESEMME